MGNSVKSALVNPRVVRLEIDRVEPLELREALLAAMRQYAFAATRITRAWLLYHEQAGTPDKIQRGVAPGPCFPGPLKAQLYRVGTAAAPLINPTAVQWMFQWLQRTFAEQASARNNRKRWCAILQGSEAHPVFHTLPLRVYRAFCTLTLEDGAVWVTPKILRAEPGGKYLPLRLRLRVPRNAQHDAEYAHARQVARGVKPLPCSQITFSHGKFYFMLTIDKPVEQRIDNDRTLILRSSRRAAYHARFGGRSALIGAQWLPLVGRSRQELIAARESSSAAHRARRQRDWRNYTRTVAHELTADIAKSVLANKIGRVVICDGRVDSALNICGLAGQRDASSFPMQMVRVFLQQKLAPFGVKVVERANLRSVKRRISRRQKRLGANQVQVGAV